MSNFFVNGVLLRPRLTQWLRALLSAPCVLKKKKKKTKDDQFAEANSLRNDADSVAKTVVFSARQMIHTIGTFKDDKETEKYKRLIPKIKVIDQSERQNKCNRLPTRSNQPQIDRERTKKGRTPRRQE